MLARAGIGTLMVAVPRFRIDSTMNDLDRILDHLNTSVFLVDRQHSVHYLNVAAETMLGLSRNQILGRSLRELLRDADELASIVDRAFDTWQPYARRELNLRSTHGGEELTVDCSVSPFEDRGISSTALLEISDATQHQRISRETALLNQVGGSRLMVRQLAHEIKNPLGGLRGAAQLLERQLDDPSMREYTSIIISEADRLKDLVDSLLGPGHTPNKELINVHELLQHVRQLLSADASPEISIERDYDPSLPPLRLDRNQMIQAMLNLGRNAVQAMQHSGRLVLRTRAMTSVSIGTRRHRLVASIQFEDNGPGVPQALQDTLFYPFVTGRAEGTGLGLAIAQDLVSRHGGLIEFESRPGRTVFTLLLPFNTYDAADGNKTA
jgi:two-component system, NtrC family, nitrogen regulation sensor histidine kinase GlnL